MKKSQIPNSPDALNHVRDFLISNPIATIATVSPSGKPHATVVYFSFNDDFSVSFVTKVGTEKHKNIKRKHDVMMVVYEASTQTSVQITGRAVDITDTPEAHEVFKNTLKAVESTSESGIPPISKLEDGRYISYKVIPSQIRMAVFARPDPGGYEMFETLTF